MDPIERPERTELPPWAKLARHKREDATVGRVGKRTPEDEAILELVTASGWLPFVEIVSRLAKMYHKALITGTSPDAVRHGHQGGLAALAMVLRTTYERAGLDFPPYLNTLLTGEIT